MVLVLLRYAEFEKSRARTPASLQILMARLEIYRVMRAGPILDRTPRPAPGAQETSARGRFPNLLGGGSGGLPGSSEMPTPSG
jgi:hypothetical protein